MPDDVFEEDPIEPRVHWPATVIRVFQEGLGGRRTKKPLMVSLHFSEDNWIHTCPEQEARQWQVNPFSPQRVIGTDLFLGMRVEVFWAVDRKWNRGTIIDLLSVATNDIILLYDDEMVSVSQQPRLQASLIFATPRRFVDTCLTTARSGAPSTSQRVVPCQKSCCPCLLAGRSAGPRRSARYPPRRDTATGPAAPPAASSRPGEYIGCSLTASWSLQRLLTRRR